MASDHDTDPAPEDPGLPLSGIAEGTHGSTQPQGVRVDTIPQVLRDHPCWVAWVYSPDPKKPGAKPRKIPINPGTGRAAKINDPKTWTTFAEAIEWSEKNGGAGVMLAITADGPFSVVDLDACRDRESGAISPEALEIVNALATYTEASPSGTGVHLVARGKLPNGRRKLGHVEMYDAARFLTFTGHHVEGTPQTVEDRSAQLAEVHGKVFPKPKSSRTAGAALTDEEVLKRAALGIAAEPFQKLWAGDHSAYPSQSEADLALCSMLGRACDGDKARIDRLFRQSKLMRSKWDERHGEQTYGERTIALASQGRKRRQRKIRGEVAVAVDGGELKLLLVHHRGYQRSKIKAILPDGRTFIDKVDLAGQTGRDRYVERIRARAPELPEDALQEGLDELAEVLLAALGEATGDERDDGDDGDDEDPSGTIAEAIVSLAVGAKDVELFHTPGRHDPEAMATVPIRGRRETVSIDSRAFKHWLVGTFRARHKKVPGSTPLQNALLAIRAEAVFSAVEHEVFVRLAAQGGVIWLDLCDEDRNAVRIAADGWSIVPHDKVEVRYVRRRGMKALPKPVHGGSINLLRPLLNLPDDTSWVLFVSVMVGFLRPSGPFPVLVVSGEQGSAKSYLCRVARGFVDPSIVPLRRPPREDRDLLIASTNAWVVAFDNISKLTDWLSDSLCSLATRGGFGTRELYTNDEEKLFDAMRPVVLNGIGDIATKPDLLDRAVILHLPTIPKEKRVPEAELDVRVAAVLPQVLGAMLDAVATALRNLPNVKLQDLPRMADFATWATTAEPAFGWEPGTFMAAYAGTQQDADAVALEASLVGTLVVEYMETEARWSGTATQLRDTFEARFSEQRTSRHKEWPRQPNAVSNELKRIAPVLRRRGIEVSAFRQPGGKRTRIITLERLDVGTGSSQPSQASQTPPDGDLRAGQEGRPRDDIHDVRDDGPGSKRPDFDASDDDSGGSRDDWDDRDDGVPTFTPAAGVGVSDEPPSIAPDEEVL